MTTDTNNPYKPIIFWLLTGCLLIFAMVVIGGITRLTHSGLSMSDWKLISGTIPPLNESEWLKAFDLYKQFPEYQKINYNFTLSNFKSIFWWEYLHRVLGRFIGIVFIIPFLLFWIKGKISKSLMPKLLILLAMGAFQGFLGWYMVKSGLVNKPHVSHYRLAAHLSTALIAFAYAFWLALGEIYKGREDSQKEQPKLLSLTKLFIGVLSVQIIYGAFVAGLKAGSIYNTFPKMGSEWLPDAILGFSPWWINFIEAHAGVQFIHRYIAYIVVALCIGITYLASKADLNQTQKTGVALLCFFVCLQFLLGVFTLIYKVPVSLGVLHQVGAFFLLSVSLFLCHRLRIQKV